MHCLLACSLNLKRLKTLPSGSGWDAVPREFQNRLTKRRNKFACSKISSSTSAILFASIFPPAQRACNFDSSAVQNVCNSRLWDRLRSSATIWKQLSLQSSAICDLRSAIVCDRLWSYGNQRYHLLIDIGQFVWSYARAGRQVIQFRK